MESDDEDRTEAQGFLDKARSELASRTQALLRLQETEHMIKQQLARIVPRRGVTVALELQIREQEKKNLKHSLQKIQGELQDVQKGITRAHVRIAELEAWLTDHE